jgi:transcriptional regulator with XRE-family HTH domain
MTKPPRINQKLARQRLRLLRARKGWTKTQAAAWYGVTLGAWSRWESGSRPVGAPLLKRVEAELELEHVVAP